MTHKALSVFDYSGNKLCDLYDSYAKQRGQAFAITEKKELNGYKELSFRMPYMMDEEENFRWAYVKSEYLVRLMDGTRTDWYVINEPSDSKNSTISVTVTCPHISTQLKTKNIYLTFDDENGIGTLQYLVNQILAGTGWTIGTCPTFLESDGVTEKVRSLKSDNKEGAYALISKVCNLFNAYPEYNGDTKTVNFYSLSAAGVEWELVVGKNMDGISVKKDSGAIVTRLYVEGEYGDYGYVGIDDVNPTGLNYLLNFDYYKDIGLFTAEHQTALDTYTEAAAAKKTEITNKQTTINGYIDDIIMAVGDVPFTVYTLKAENNYWVLNQEYRVNGATKTPEAGDDIIGIIGNLIATSTCEYIKVPSNGRYQTEYNRMVYFERPPIGQIGVKEAAISAKNAQIESWTKKQANATEDARIEECNQAISILRSEINEINTGTNSDGLYNNLAALAVNAVLYVFNSNTLQRLLSDLDALEATFVAAMGEMLRDGRWSDENYAPGQEEALYNDALAMSERCGKPEYTYTMTYKSAKEAIGFGAEDIGINSVGHIWDEELGVNAYGYIKSVTIVHDHEAESKIEVTTDDGFSKQVSLESVMTRIAQMAELVKTKNEIYNRAGALSSAGKLATERLNGMMDVMRNQLSSSASNWYTDDRGNIIFESINGLSAMMLCGEGFMVANGKNSDGSWNWRTLGTGSGICADEITTGFLSAERILAGSITTDKVAGSFGQQIDLSENSIILGVNQSINDAKEGASTELQQTMDAFKMTVSKTYLTQEAAGETFDDLYTKTNQVEKYLSFGDDYLVISTNANNFNVQITNEAINFRNGERVLAYMNNQKLYIAESEVTQAMQIGSYKWAPQGTSGAVAFVYTGS